MSFEKRQYQFFCDDSLHDLEEAVNGAAAAGYRLTHFQVCAEAHYDEGYPRTANGTDTWYYAAMEFSPLLGRLEMPATERHRRQMGHDKIEIADDFDAPDELSRAMLGEG